MPESEKIFEGYDEDWLGAMQFGIKENEKGLKGPCPGCGKIHDGPTPFAILSVFLQAHTELVKVLHASSALTHKPGDTVPEGEEFAKTFFSQLQLLNEARSVIQGIAATACVISESLMKQFKAGVAEYEKKTGEKIDIETVAGRKLEPETKQGPHEWADLD